MSAMSTKAMKKINWSGVWAFFFTICTTSFAVMVMLKLTKTVEMTWGVVLLPVLIEVAVPLFVLLGALIVDIVKGAADGKGE